MTYLRTVRRSLVCNFQTKKRFLSQVRGLLDEYLRIHPEGTIEDMVREIGTPEEMAAALMDGVGPGEFRETSRRKGRLAMLFALLAAMTLLFLFSLSLCLKNSGKEQYYINEKTIVYAEAPAPEAASEVPS